MEKPTTIDEYIASFPSETQKILQRLREDLQRMIPDAKQKISYAIPTFTLNGNLIHFAGYKNHIGLYPGSKAVEALAEDLKGYHTSKGTVQFPIDKPLPIDLIEKIVAFCVAQNLAKKKKG
ncbi:MAG: DUF1801 domain-containing protein [Pedobacter sp.]|uniref:iron chaperone n=1 Tax=Pedobacter sp. TaxID=1411316 RepID=UPI0028095F19|nr:DUF1801 domain-containing protein [Pedobacter sp.]MDQ8006274.1 DUF1801 domain-containing protein [Pedobacter sp.]